MEYFDIEDSTVRDFLVQAFGSGNLVPVLGSGFSAGSLAGSGAVVLSGEELFREMVKAIENGKRSLGADELDDLRRRKFGEVADYYFDDEYVDQALVRETLRKHFCSVSLDNVKSRFLNNIKWAYLYTLNADDAIEKNSHFEKIHPYDNQVDKRSRDLPCVYKLHGDVWHELATSEDRLIFRKTDYLESIDSNKSMLALLREDLLNKNILFIGCSLKDEDDLAFAIAKKMAGVRKGTRRILFSTRYFNKIEESDLERHGVDTVVRVKRDERDRVYTLLEETYLASADDDADIRQYQPNFTILEKEPDRNKAHIIAGVTDLEGGQPQNRHILPYYAVERMVASKIRNSISENPVVLVRGKRISGKTQILYSLGQYEKRRRVILLDSYDRVSASFFNKMLGLSNTLLLIDEGAVDKDRSMSIKKNYEYIRKAGSAVVIVIGYDDNNTPEWVRPSRMQSMPVFEVSHSLNKEEWEAVNKKLKSVRCPALPKGKSLLDSLFSVYTALGENNVIRRIEKSKVLFKVLYIIGVRRRLSGEDVRFAEIDPGEVDEKITELEPYLEWENIPRTEVADHSGYRVICNSDAWLLAVMSEFYRAKGSDWCARVAYELISKVARYDRGRGIELSLFDSINALFSRGVYGAGELIIRIYDYLEEVRGEEPEFYVQKAKAYYNIYKGEDVVEVLGERLSELGMAKSWAEAEGRVESERNIRHMAALVSLRRAWEGEFSDVEHVILAVTKVEEAIQNGAVNKDYVRKLVSGKIKGGDYLKGLVGYFERGGVADARVLAIKGQIDEVVKTVRMAGEYQ